MKLLKKVLTLNCLLVLFLVGCTSVPKNPESEAEKQINACLPNAIIMAQALRRQNVWAKVLVVRWNREGRINGHAYTVFLYPPGQNQLWSYDRDWGSMRVRAYKDDPLGIARQANNQRNLYWPLTQAEYLD
jgi:hypothetical protein